MVIRVVKTESLTCMVSSVVNKRHVGWLIGWLKRVSLGCLLGWLKRGILGVIKKGQCRALLGWLKGAV